jgi:transposase
MRFEETYSLWTEGRLTQEEAARILGVHERSFRRHIDRYRENGLDGLIDKRLSQASARKAPVDEVMALADRYRNRHKGWNVSHFHDWYKKDGGTRSYTWVKNTLQEKNLVAKSPKRGKHRKRRPRSPLPGMMLHQDGSTHEWVPGKTWDLIVTMDDATNEHLSMFFVEQEGTLSSFRAMREIILKKGLCCTFYTDRGSHYWYTPKAGGKVDKNNPTQFGRSMHQLGIEMIAAYSPEARGRSERAFHTHQDRLVNELKFQGITTMEAANQYLDTVYRPAFNARFTEKPAEEGSAFVPWIGGNLDDYLSEHFERTVGRDNCVSFEKLTLQIPSDSYRFNYIKTKVRIHRYADRSLALFYGPRKLATYDRKGQIIDSIKKAENQ